ncbi:MAG: 50S ribosomal protein L22 [Nitrososphaerota archaeon]|jgi:large subunit ribosomal protein L22|nr:50S ribosomal protein L22 [Nitrososphaerota archaeon]MDG6948416.1 50S ribosomal protein L22 [Nitrososphaerota archaeon]
MMDIFITASTIGRVYERDKVPHHGYSFQGFDPAVHVRASGREVNISPKAAREVALTIKGMLLTRAIDLLEQVESKEMPIAFRRHKLKVGHRSELQGFPTGSYPVRTAKAYLGVLHNLQGNTEFKGLDPERVKIIHAAGYAGRTVKDYYPRAFGRSSPNFHQLVHIEVVGKEV